VQRYHDLHRPLVPDPAEDLVDQAAIGGGAGRRGIHTTWSIAEQLRDRPFLVSDRMTIAHPYLFVMLTWAAMFEIEVS
jgi:glutathione S-transferase